MILKIKTGGESKDCLGGSSIRIAHIFYTCNVGAEYLTLRLLHFGLGFKLPLGAVNGPSLETFRNSSRSLRPWGETGLAAVATLQTTVRQ